MKTIDIVLVVMATLTVELAIAVAALILIDRKRNGEFHEDVVGGSIAVVCIAAMVFCFWLISTYS